MGDDPAQVVAGPLRIIQPEWDWRLIVAAFAISFLGSFTSTQLMCQAKTSRYFSGVLVWTILGSLIFGFCSIWCLHFVATLACGLDLEIKLNVGLTILSAFLAVLFTFCALGGQLLWKSYRRERRKRKHKRKYTRDPSESRRGSEAEGLLRRSVSEDVYARQDTKYQRHKDDMEDRTPLRFAVTQQSPSGFEQLENPMDAVASPDMPQRPLLTPHQPDHFPGMETVISPMYEPERGLSTQQEVDEDYGEDDDSTIQRSSENGSSERSSSFAGSSSTISQLGMGKFISIRTRRKVQPTHSNLLVATVRTLLQGFTLQAVCYSLCWSAAIGSMHYVGIYALIIPSGFVTVSYLWVLSMFIAFIVCGVALTLFREMETHLAQQILFSAVAAGGIGAMHFTGMAATTFYTVMPPTVKRGYPSGLAAAIVAVAVITCIVANGLLAHSATVSRDKLAEIFHTRKKMWQAIAQKENAETAAQARSDFIASASHEIRTPLHQLQGYSDLLSRTELTDEGRLLLYAIQHATKTLSLITTNVLDWSRLEKHGDTKACQLVALDMRQVCEAVINLLPNKDEDNEAEILVVVAPDVPHSLFVDETYIHRVLMNLLSNATKFTSFGYILLLVEMKDGKLVVTVRDTGCGIPPNFLPQLFDPFTQAETLGAHRGTGLGLSIIKQLLNKMNGDIVVKSKYAATVGTQFSGSEFIATVPVPSPYEVPSSPVSIAKVAIFHDGNAQYFEGLQTAWKHYGTEVVPVQDQSEVGDIRYVWIDISLLQRRPEIYSWLAHQRQLLVLVTYETQLAMDYVFGMASAPRHFITLRKPLIWHSILHAVALIEAGTRSSPEKSVRFAPEVSLMEEPKADVPFTILLVEDNKINLRLMQKMLTTLKYSVLVAMDGQEAIDQTLKHDTVIDAILMDQSMPTKDGLTATKEIRELERDGTLSKRHAIIAVTAVVSSESQDLSESAGTDDFLAKPVSLVKLGSCLEKWLRRS